MRRSLILLGAFALVTRGVSAQPAGGGEPGFADLAVMAQRVGSQVRWVVSDPAVLEEGRNRIEVMQSLQHSADFDRLANLDKVLAQAREQKRLVLWYAPRITAGSRGRQMYRPAVLDGYANAILFSDPTVVELINRKFLPLRLVCDEKVGQKVGVSAPEMVEPAVFLLLPDGTVARHVHSLRSFNTAWFLQFLHQALEANPSLNGPSSSLAEVRARHQAGEVDDLDLALERLRDGEWPEVAKELANSDAVAREARDQARLLLVLGQARRLGGDPEGALAALDQAAKVLADGGEATPEGRPPAGARGRRRQSALLADITCERGRALLLKGDMAEAAAAFGRVRSGDRRAEAEYHLGLCDFFDGNETFAVRRWKKAAALNPEDPFAWKAAANLVDGADRTPLGPTLHGFEDPFQVRAPDFQTTSSARPRTREEIRDLARGAVSFLLRMQRENGGWDDSRYAYWPTPDQTPNVWVAATALACAALREWQDLAPEGADEAIRRGERYMFDERYMARGYQEEIYADAYKLIYLARAYDLTKAAPDRQRIIATMNQVVRDLAETQGRGAGPNSRGVEGFWAHEYPNPFCTAAVMNGLHLARERGASVPVAMLQAGAAALLGVRDENGAFSYGSDRNSPGPAEDRLKNSMGRSPICEAAILWSGAPEGTPARVSAAMDNFWSYLPRLVKVRKCDFHTDGELAGFFFWHALFHTTEAIKALPPEAQEAHREKMLDLLLQLGELDGSFIDSHEMGKSYGTAMGLLSLKNALMDRKP